MFSSESRLGSSTDFIVQFATLKVWRSGCSARGRARGRGARAALGHSLKSADMPTAIGALLMKRKAKDAGPGPRVVSPLVAKAAPRAEVLPPRSKWVPPRVLAKPKVVPAKVLAKALPPAVVPDATDKQWEDKEKKDSKKKVKKKDKKKDKDKEKKDQTDQKKYKDNEKKDKKVKDKDKEKDKDKKDKEKDKPKPSRRRRRMMSQMPNDKPPPPKQQAAATQLPPKAAPKALREEWEELAASSAPRPQFHLSQSRLGFVSVGSCPQTPPEALRRAQQAMAACPQTPPLQTPLLPARPQTPPRSVQFPQGEMQAQQAHEAPRAQEAPRAHRRRARAPLGKCRNTRCWMREHPGRCHRGYCCGRCGYQDDNGFRRVLHGPQCKRVEFKNDDADESASCDHASDDLATVEEPLQHAEQLEVEAPSQRPSQRAPHLEVEPSQRPSQRAPHLEVEEPSPQPSQRPSQQAPQLKVEKPTARPSQRAPQRAPQREVQESSARSSQQLAPQLEVEDPSARPSAAQPRPSKTPQPSKRQAALSSSSSESELPDAKLNKLLVAHKKAQKRARKKAEPAPPDVSPPEYMLALKNVPEKFRTDGKIDLSKVLRTTG